MIFRVLIVGMVFVAQSLGAVTELRDIRFSELPGDRVEIRATFSEQPVFPKGYALEKPARIVLDFPGIKSALPQKKYTLGLGNLKSAVVLTANERTRFILNLSFPAGYTTSVEGNDLVAVVDNTQVADNTFVRRKKQVDPVSAASSVAAFSRSHSVLDVDFRRDERGAGKVMLKLSDPKVSVDVEKNIKGISVSLSKTSVSEALQRRLDVIDFATPVQFVETRADGDKVNIVIEAQGQYEYLAYQADESYVISVSPLTQEQIEEQKTRFKYTGEKLSLNFQDIEVRKVLEIIADFTDLNLVASDTVSGNITLRLDSVPWDQALDLVLKSKGLDKRQAGNILLVAPATEIAERERQELESRKQLQELEPLVTEFIVIRYAKADDILQLITGSAAPAASATSGATASDESALTTVLSSRGTAVVDYRTNAIILTDIAENIEGIKSLIEKVDIPVRQVMIEARIVSASDDFREQLGFSFSATQDTDVTVGRDLGGDITTNLGPLETEAATLGVGIDFLPGNLNINLEIAALESSGYGEVISQPRVLTGDKQTAKIESGQQVPFTSSDGDSVSTVFQDAVLSLEVTPQITPDGRIIMELKINRDSLDTGTVTASGSPINVTELTTTALVGDGDTIVLGGIFEQSKSTAETKVPILGDIPLLGRIFRNNVDIDDRSELLIFITPRILTDSILDK